MSQADKFHQAMINIYKVAADECNYRAKGFLGMVVEMGGVAAAKKLLASNDIQSGLYELFDCGRLDLTVETLVLQDEYRSLFSPGELAEAQRRLDLLKRRSR
jgi:hypothetical protein